MSTRPQPGVGPSARPPAARRAPAPGDTRPDDDERGMVTAELAVVLPAVALVLLLVLAAIATGAQHIRATDAAQAGARAAAAGESSEVVLAHARQLAPDDATITVRRDDGLVVVEVVAGWPGPLAVTGGQVTASASAVPEEALVGGTP
ncbi:TadE family type IV pilus minor pilin [Georgenia sp. Z1344]|uniref:TadE family type IV pilus minor pilin n=1 Tax=Georgenia sp. Z1344 TaxID=3416706 RepID=UPI003CEE1D68